MAESGKTYAVTEGTRRHPKSRASLPRLLLACISQRFPEFTVPDSLLDPGPANAICPGLVPVDQ